MTELDDLIAEQATEMKRGHRQPSEGGAIVSLDSTAREGMPEVYRIPHNRVRTPRLRSGQVFYSGQWRSLESVEQKRAYARRPNYRYVHSYGSFSLDNAVEAS